MSSGRNDGKRLEHNWHGYQLSYPEIQGVESMKTTIDVLGDRLEILLGD